MRRDSLRTFFEASPTARLLRSDLAPLVIDFLNETFKAGEAIALGQNELKSLLAAYQDDVHEVEPNLMIGPPEQYLTKWTEHGWLTRFLQASSSEAQYQLTPHAEQAIRFVDSILSKGDGLVGTESRLKLVIETLEDIVRGASADPERRLEYLTQQRAAIDEEIEAIKSGKSVQVYRPSEIRERFQTAVELLKALQSDFRAVEERFQEITRDVQQRQTSGEQTRGGILGHALDAEDLLKQQDEGVSFFAFVAFLFSPTQQNALRKTIEEVQQLAALAEDSESILRVRRMVPSLLAEADKVMKTTARLSSTLRRLLDARAAAHRVRLASVLNDIKLAALELRGKAPQDCILSPITDLELSSPLARTFWKPSITFDDQTLSEHVVDISRVQQVAGAFAKLQRLDFRKLRGVIREYTHDGSSIRLSDLVDQQPLTSGVVEVLGYLQLAHDDGHEIARFETDTITVESTHASESASGDLSRGVHAFNAASRIKVRVPRVTFLPKSRTKTIGRQPR